MVYLYYDHEGILYSENVNLQTLLKDLAFEEGQAQFKADTLRLKYDVPSTPVFVYSVGILKENVTSYLHAFRNSKIDATLGYAIKANPNIHIVQELKKLGVEMIVAVSGFEVLTAIKAGFDPKDVLLNGNGKQDWEIKLAIENGVKMNVDSVIDAQRMVNVSRKVAGNKEVDVILRIRPDESRVKATELREVHEYLNTAHSSKFGFTMTELQDVLDVLETGEKFKIIGVHSHFGSGIMSDRVFSFVSKFVKSAVDEIRSKGIQIDIVNVGGGFGLDYFRNPTGLKLFLPQTRFQNKFYQLQDECSSQERKYNPNCTIASYVRNIAENLPKDVKVIMEPGRSLVGDAGVLLCKVLGIKADKSRNFMVIDGSMNEVIRPCLYGAHHQILPVTIKQDETWEPFDVVGPICESADFLGRKMPLQRSSEYLAVFDVGAYCSGMSSSYNLKPQAAEILVKGSEWKQIKKRETLDNIIEKYSC